MLSRGLGYFPELRARGCDLGLLLRLGRGGAGVVWRWLAEGVAAGRAALAGAGGWGCLVSGTRVFSLYVAQAGSARPQCGRACSCSVQPGW